MGKRKALFSVNRGGVVSTSFIMSVKTDNTGTSNNDQFTIPTTGGGYNYNIDTVEHSLTGQTGSVTLTFASAGTYDIEISGTFPRIYFNNGGDKAKLLDIKNWGDIGWTNMQSAFRGCTSLTNVTAADTPDLSSCTNMGIMFQGNTNMATINNLNDWDLTNVVTCRNLFKLCSNFNQDISGWDMSSVTNFDEIFSSATAFNSALPWDTSAVTAMSLALYQASSFDQDISGWDINQVTNLGSFLTGGTLSTANYDALLIAWDAQGSMSYSGTVNFGSSKYTSGGAAETARTSLISKWGGISDGGAA